VHVDAVEEALKVKSPRNARPKRQLRDFAVRQLKRSEKYQRELDKALEKARKTGAPIDPVLVQAVQTAKSITDTMMTAIEQVRRSEKSEREKMSGLTDDQLMQVLITQLPRIADEMDDEQWRALLGTRWSAAVIEVLLRGTPHDTTRSAR
jgi:hypothetical protein